MFNILLRHTPKRARLSLHLQKHSLSTRHEISREDRMAFHDVLPNVIDSAVANPKVAEISGLDKWLKELLTYNMTGGKGARGLSVVMAYEMLEQPEKLTDESMKLAHTLGWCYEMFQSFMCIVDDIMDGSETRRGKPCWYRMPNVGAACATNDSIMLYSCMFYLIKKYFGERDCYKDILDAVNETMLYSTFGQYLDYKTANRAKESSIFTVETNLTINKYKTAYYTYDLPVTLGLLLADYKVDGETRKQMKDVSLEIGLLFQMQDDYIDCFGDENVTGKFGTDIQEGKCSWLAVTALQRCNSSQRIVFNACFGSREPAHVERCKQLYCDLQLPQLYKELEGQYYNDIFEKIRRLPSDELRRLFHALLGITYQRKK